MEQEKKNFTDRYNNLYKDLKSEVINLVQNNPYSKSDCLDFDVYKSNEAVQDILMDNMVQGYDEYASCFFDAYVREIFIYDDGTILVNAYSPLNDCYVDDVSISVDSLYTLWYILNEIKKL